MHGLDVLRAIQDLHLPTRTVVFTAALDDDEIVHVLRLGARGLLLKEMSPHALLECVRSVYAGGLWLERQWTKRAVERLLRRETGMRRIVPLLSPLQIEALRAVAKGARNDRIAQKLRVSEETLRTHLRHIYEKLGVRSRSALIKFAEANALV
jgi:DNA-binding NarL/FixJ family response regulator